MAEEQQDDKTEEPTDKKRRDSREEGQVAFSREIPSTLIFGGSLLIAVLLGEFILDRFLSLLVFTFQNPIQPEINIFIIEDFVEFYSIESFKILGPLFIIVLAVALLSSYFQIGVLFTGKPLVPKLEKISIFKGIKRLFSVNTINEFFKTIAKLAIIGYAGYFTVLGYIDEILLLPKLEVTNIISLFFQIIAILCFRIFIAFLIIALFDYGFQRWNHEQKLKMSRQEIKDENKQTEGDPQVRQRIRQAQISISQGRMMQDVPNADVVVTNPTHFAIALKYDREENVAPRLIAKGKDLVALRMMEIAKKSKVAIVRNPPVARGIFASIKIGDEIPEEFYKAIAEILAQVYRQKIN